MPDPRIHVDFNGIQEDGRLNVLRRHADNPSSVLPGALVQLWDEDGNSALGRVIEVGEHDLAQVEVMLDTWSDGPVETLCDDEGMYAYQVQDLPFSFGAFLWTGTTAATVRPQRMAGPCFVLASAGYLGLPGTFEKSYELHAASGGAPTTTVR